jgi:hypothetical protein
VNKLIFLFFVLTPAFCLTQVIACGADIGYGISSPKTDVIFFRNKDYIKEIIHNSVNAEYIFKGDKVSLALELGIIKKGSVHFSTNNLNMCFKITRYYQNRLTFSFGTGIDVITKIYGGSLLFHANQSVTNDSRNSFFFRPSLGYSFIENSSIRLRINTGFDFSVTPYNYYTDSKQSFIFYNRYAFTALNFQYKFKKIKKPE